MSESELLPSAAEKLSMVDKFVVRFPSGMRQQIHTVANRCRRSMNKEIVARLEHSLEHFPTVPTQQPDNPMSPRDLAVDDILQHQSPEADIIVNHRLRLRISELDFSQKYALLKFLKTV